MAVYIVTGKLGNGKTLVSVGRIQDKLLAGCPVATNLDLNLSALLSETHRSSRLIRVPDKPSAADLHAIGVGNASYDESKNGLLVLDECGTWFNSRNWQDKSRQAVNDWFLHARKLGWDVILIVQDIKLVDSQARDAIAEHTVFCRRLDNLHIPFIGTIFKILTAGSLLRLPRVHVGKVIYGTSENDPFSDRWVYRGNRLFRCYDTKQAFLADYPHGVFCELTPWHRVGRHRMPRDWRFYMRMTRIMWKRFKSPVALAAGVLLGVAFTAATAFASIYQDLERQREMLAAETPAPAPDPAPVPLVEETPPDPMPERLRGLRIIGSVEFQDRRWYQFEVEGSDGQTVDSTVLAQQGVQVQYRNECHARLHYNGEIYNAHCW